VDEIIRSIDPFIHPSSNPKIHAFGWHGV